MQGGKLNVRSISMCSRWRVEVGELLSLAGILTLLPSTVHL